MRKSYLAGILNSWRVLCCVLMALLEAINYLREETTTRKPSSRIDEAVGVVWDVALESGLEPDSIKSLIEFVSTGSKNGGISTKSHIVRCLIPSTTVPVSALMRALCSMRMLPLSLQLLLFRWMVLVFDVVDDPKRFLSLYDIIFQYLGYDELRPSVCQLLCYMTKRKHVKEFRIHRLMDLSKQVVVQRDSSESSLMALLAIYKLHSPHLVPMANLLGKRKKVWFRPFEKKLADNITRVQHKRAGTLKDKATVISSSDRFHKSITTIQTPASKRRKKSHSIPSLLPSYAQAESDVTRLPVAVLTSVHELCDNIHQLELPGQMGAVLESSLLQHVFSIWPDPSASTRLTYWLQAYLGNELDLYCPDNQERPLLLHMLKCSVKLTEFLMEPIPTMEMFLLILLESWNGLDYRDEVFKLLSYLSLQNFDDLESHYLDPMKQHFVKRDLQFKCSTLSCLTNLIGFWALLEWPRYRKSAGADFESVEHLRLSAFADSVWYDEDYLNFNPSDSLRLLVKYTERLSRIGLEQENGHALIKHASARLYELVTSLPEDYGVPLLLVPHPQIVNHCFLGVDPTALSRLLSCYNRCKENLSNTEKAQRDPSTIKRFNSVVLDMCDSLWRDLAFSSTSVRKYPTHLFTTTEEHLKKCGFHAVKNKLSIIHHPALLGFVKEFFIETQGEAHHRFKPGAIWKEDRFKQAYLDYLHQMNLTGISSFIHTFIKN